MIKIRGHTFFISETVFKNGVRLRFGHCHRSRLAEVIKTWSTEPARSAISLKVSFSAPASINSTGRFFSRNREAIVNKDKGGQFRL